MFTIDNKSRIPIYRQIIDNIERLAARGLLPPDSQLPSVRSLAVDLSINPNTIAKAYGELETRGIIYSLPGRGSFITSNTDLLRQEAKARLTQKLQALVTEAIAISLNKADFLEIIQSAWEEIMAKEVDQID